MIQFYLAIAILALYWYLMTCADNTPVIGIDGGGTNCRFATLHHGHRVEVTGGSANVSSDPAAARDTLRDGLIDLARAANLNLSDITHFPTFIGLAGMVDQSIAIDLARDLPLANVQIEDDRRTAMVGALGASDGCVICIGTGSFLGRRVAGVDRLIGGWGLTLGDNASGAFLGRQLLRRVLEAHDGTQKPSPLTQDILAQFSTPAAIVTFAGQARPSDFAQFAPRIMAGARADDPTATALVREGAQYIERALGHLGWQSGQRICPLGGLAPHYAPFLSPDIAAHLSVPDGTALDGALMLAARMGDTV